MGRYCCVLPVCQFYSPTLTHFCTAYALLRPLACLLKSSARQRTRWQYLCVGCHGANGLPPPRTGEMALGSSTCFVWSARHT